MPPILELVGDSFAQAVDDVVEIDDVVESRTRQFRADARVVGSSKIAARTWRFDRKDFTVV